GKSSSTFCGSIWPALARTGHSIPSQPISATRSAVCSGLYWEKALLKTMTLKREVALSARSRPGAATVAAVARAARAMKSRRGIRVFRMEGWDAIPACRRFRHKAVALGRRETLAHFLGVFLASAHVRRSLRNRRTQSGRRRPARAGAPGAANAE